MPKSLGRPLSAYLVGAWSLLAFLPLLFPSTARGALDLPPDPTEHTLYACYEDARHTFDDASISEQDGDPVGPVEGRIYWPVQCGDPTDTPVSNALPMVLVVHGDGHDLDDYHSTLVHLARNGFVVATIDGRWEVSNLQRAERVRTYLRFLRQHWTFSSFTSKTLGLFGHSRGGEGVVTAARKIRQWGLDVDVDAVVSLAPTDRPSENGGNEGPENLHSEDADAFLVIYGSKDSDVKGRIAQDEDAFLACQPPPGSPMRTGFSLHDRAGREGSTEPPLLPGTNAIHKSMLFVDRATHGCWRDGFNCFGPWISGEKHRTILRAYLSAFFRWHLRGESELAYFFTSDWRPGAVAEDGVTIRQQYSEAIGRRVIDDFQNGGWSTGTLGPVTRSSFLDLSVREDPAFEQSNCSIPHDTDVLVLSWNRPNPFLVSPWIRWSIPDDTNAGGRALRDFSGFTHLSLRAGQLWGDPNNDEDRDQRFSLRLRDASGNRSLDIPSRLFQQLPYPDPGDFFGPLDVGIAPKSSLHTLRFPLAYVHGVDLRNITEVELRFDDPERLAGALVLDNLELVTAEHNVLGMVPTELVNGLPIADIEADRSQERYFFIDVPEDARNLEISIDGEVGDADLYVRYGLEPTVQFFDCRPFGATSTEKCHATLPAAGRHYVMVRGFRDFEDLTILASHETGGPPCTDCDLHTGHLDFPGDADNQPNGSWYWSANPGLHQAWLSGPDDADFDLYLYQWNGFGWTPVASSTSPDSEEEVAFAAWQPGYFLWQVRSYSGSGAYELWLQHP